MLPASHARKVAALARTLFDSLQSLHGLPPSYGKALEAASYLHDSGHYISDTRHHRHSYYLVANSDMPGFTERERHLVANLCRYHRKSPPSAAHSQFQALDAEGKRAINMLTPLLRLADIHAIAAICAARRVRLCVDNTFMTPYFQRPIELGAQLVVHSATKYLNGHSDMVGGIVVSNDLEASERLRFLQNAAGAVPGPFDCWLVLRGIKTLAVRMDRHESNARAIAAWLAQHKKLSRVLYPGLPDHPGRALHQTQASGFGGMIAFDVGSIEKGAAVLPRTKVFSLAESLGGVESLISHPATMTHASVPREEREKVGLTDGLIRISVGIEDVDDLIADLDQALAIL
jgi:O-acetylhomoserine/O-acetylserine sulfhydrylase-like pyridoxal-dependent enzyme